MIEIKDLTIGYTNKVIAENLTATLQPGMLTCLVGRNGVGKSTLLRTIGGFQRPLNTDASRRVTICEKDITCISKAEMARLVSVVLTGRPQVQMLTVEEIVGLGRSPYTDMWGTLRTEDRAIVNDAIARVGVSHLADRRISSLSDGECQKVMIAKALAQQTPVILLDEPTAFLDYPSKMDTMLLMKQLATTSGVTTLLSTHDMEMAIHLADQLWVMTSDRRLVCGTPHELEDLLIDEKLKLVLG